MKKIPKIGDLVRVLWLDAFGSATEDYTQADIEAAKPLPMTTYGILIRQDAEVVGLAAETDGSNYRGVTFIPTAIVVSVELPRRKRSKGARVNTPSA